MTSTPRTSTRRRRRERGQATIEFIGWIPVMLFAFLLCLEGFTYFWVAEQATSAARAGARVSGQGGDGYAAASNALSSGVRDRAQITAGGGTSTVTARVPVLAVIDVGWTVKRSATMPIG